MIYKRVAARLQAQDWVAITIELAIVIIGVFIGTQVANWNQDRLNAQATRRTVTQLRPELTRLGSISRGLKDYYANTRHYAETAIAGWKGDPKVSDRDFVIAAYQASQIYGLGKNGQAWALVFGADELRNIDDPRLRNPLMGLMTFDYPSINYVGVQSRYRDDVREIIPDSIQQEIRSHCGDRRKADGITLYILPTCDLPISPREAAQVAAELRAHPELPRELNLHLAGVATLLNNLDLFERQRSQLAARIDEIDRRAPA